MMVLRHNGKRFLLHPYKVKFVKDGIEYEKAALPNKRYWEELALRDNFNISFEEIVLSLEQKERYEEICKIECDEGLTEDFENYILEGKYPDENINEESGEIVRVMSIHPLMVLKKEKNIQLLEQDNADLWYEVMIGGV